jgi:hypothetical protein
MASQWTRKYALSAAAERFFPQWSVTLVLDGDFSQAAGKLGSVDRVAFSPSQPDIDAATAWQFVEKNVGCLFLTPGPLTRDGLRESALTAVSSDEELIRRWRKLVRNVRAGMHEGATAHNPVTGGTRHVPSHRFTDGARLLASQGIKLLASGGWVEFRPDGPG